MAATTSPEKARVLVVDDEQSIVEVLKALLRREGYFVATASDGTAALDLLQRQPFDLMISDIRMRPMDGISLLQQARLQHPHLAVVMITAYAAVETAVEAMKFGAFDYICKPFKIDELILTVQRALSYEHALAENESLKETFLTTKYHYGMVGDSEKMQRIYEMIEKIARTESPVFISGEGGVGKGMVAKAMHETSRRAAAPFVTINCASFNEGSLDTELFGCKAGAFPGVTTEHKGLLETTHGGTLFIDEVHAMPMPIQEKLLHVLLDREILPQGSVQAVPVDVRIVAASCERMEGRVRLGMFREDLFFRLSMITLDVPPLSERADDIPLLVNHFLTRFNEKSKSSITIDKQVIRAFCNYNWPGNVSELETVVTQAAALCSTNIISINELPPEIKETASSVNKTAAEAASQLRGQSLKAFLRAKERDYIQSVLNQCGGNKEKAAEALGISLATFYRKYGDLNGG